MSRVSSYPLIARSGAAVALCLVLGAAAGGKPCRAQTVTPNFAIHSWDARDGLPPGLINDIQRTANGYLWVATRVGLVRFDGARFKLFDTRNAPGLRTNWVTCLLAQPGNELWVGTPDGLFRFQEATPGAAVMAEVGTRLGVGSLAAGSPGVVWALSLSNELVRVLGERVDRRLTVPGGLPIRALAAGASGQIAVACGNAVYSVDSDNLFKQATAMEGRGDISALCSSRSGSFWVAAGREVRLLNGGSPRSAPSAGAASGGSPPAQITVMLEDREGRLWAGTRNGGIYWSVAGSRWHQLTARRSRSFGGITCLVSDSEGLIWAGTSAGILRQLKPQRVTVWSLPTTVREHVPQTVCATRDGTVWIGTDGAGAYRCRDGVFTLFGPQEGLTSATVMAILEDRQTNLWFGTYNGLFRLDGGKLRPELESVLSGQAVPALFQDQAGDLWLGLAGAVLRKRREVVRTFDLGEGFQDFEVRAFAEDRSGALWIGTYGGGLFRLEDERVTRDERFPRPAVTALHSDAENSLWVGTLNNGLFQLQNGNLGHWRTKEGLPGNTVYAILEDDAGMLWLSSNEGVCGLSKQVLQTYPGEPGTPVAPIQLATSDFENWSAGSGQPAAAKGSDGRLWFPVGHGVLSFDPAAVMRTRPALPVLIEQVLVDGVERPLPEVNALRVLSGVRRLEVSFTLADLDAPGRLRFCYKLEGLDDQWMVAGTDRVASYGHLPPGHYRFRVIASGSQSGWSELAAPLAVEVVPRLWERRWFRLLGAAAILSLVAVIARGIERIKVRRKLERLELQRSMEKERLRIARDLHDDLGAGLTEIMLLGEVARQEGGSATEARSQITTITEKARCLATAMDEVVWTVNPKNDLLPNLASYLCDHAREFFRAASARCRIDMAEPLPAAPLTAQMRHNLFLAVKEALNNAAKHSGATEIWLRIRCEANELRVTVADNGRGFDPAAVTAPRNGLGNMRERLEAVGGRAEIESRDGQGATVRFFLPLPPPE